MVKAFHNPTTAHKMHYKELAGNSMPSPDLQKQCKDLLNKLRINQETILQNLRHDECTTNLAHNLQTSQTDPKPVYGRKKLKSIIKQPSECCLPQNPSLEVPCTGQQDLEKQDQGLEGPESQKKKFRLVQGAPDASSDKTKKTEKADEARDHTSFQPVEAASYTGETTDNWMDGSHKEGKQAPSPGAVAGAKEAEWLLEEGSSSFMESNPLQYREVLSTGAVSTTPVAVRRRRIIDKNVQVDSQIGQADLRDTENTPKGLNFSYSHDAEGDETTAKAVSGKSDSEIPRTEDPSNVYRKHLGDDGNNRKLNGFIRDTTIKPKSLLNSTQPYNSISGNKRVQGASFSSSTSGDNLFRGQSGQRRLLGYDWIAALIDNDQDLMDESESYFQELREFRRCNRDECCNDFYMEGPFTLTETESPLVEKALNEHKVLPYTVNERLFTVPAKANLGQPDAKANPATLEEPTQEDPRFVRVSIPRSTLQSPYKLRPHRRHSFESSDTCSLTDHCLLGWNAVRPTTLPAATSLALADSSAAGSRHNMTLAEAERAAASFQWPLLPDPRPRAEPLPSWRKLYKDTAVNFPNPYVSLSSSAGDGASLRRRTDDLLSCTYSMMYEMQRAREQRGEQGTEVEGGSSS